ncbi:MAG: hypothetical protein H0X42_04305, partial [Solirubrobacterales bacterium]|nr:hypothetical protein [Solirubrobacterales bacterium]
MAWTRAAVLLVLSGAVALVLVSGGSDADPRTPAALPGLPPPFLGTAVTGSGGMSAAVDAYGDVVDLRPSPGGRALIDNPADRQAAGTVPTDTGIVPRLSLGGGPARPLWRADSVAQRYLPGTNVVRTVGRFGRTRIVVTTATSSAALAETVAVRGPVGAGARPSLGIDLIDGAGARCAQAGAAGGRGTAIVCR